MGAAWGQNLPIKCVVLPDTDTSLLKKPLADLHFHMWENPNGWIKLVGEVADGTENELRLRKKPALMVRLSQRIAAFRA